MTPDRWRLIESIFDACLEAEAHDRDGLLTRRCAGDVALRREVEALLAHAEKPGGPDADGRLEEIVGRSQRAVFEGADLEEKIFEGHGGHRAGERIGPYRLVRCLGEGGMGSVWRAVRADDEFEQEVAIKFVGAAGRARGWEERFRSERQILAQLEHPHIARLLDGGSTDDGQPFLVMELVDGEELLAFCDARRIGLRERLRLFLQVVSAVDHAHRHLVVHRDLKPANILVHPDAGPKLLDFGIAKLLRPSAEAAHDADGGDTSAREPPAREPTLPHERLLTPDYASPEQILGQPITVASDVYSLGVLLCELLTGRRPRRLRELTPAQRERHLIDTAPTAPSALARRTDGVAGDLAAHRGLDAARLARSLRGDLDTIASMKPKTSCCARSTSGARCCRRATRTSPGR